MNLPRLMTLSVLLLSGLTMFAQEPAARPAEGYQALVKEYEEALAAFQEASRQALTPQARQKVFEERYPAHRKYAPRFFDFATKNPKSPDAIAALIWVITHPVESTAKESALGPQALELLLENHPNNNRLGTVCTALIFTIDPASEAFIRGVSTRSTLPENQARALASLAQNRKYRARLIQSLKDDPKLLQEYENKYGKPILQTLMKNNPDDLRAESRKYFQQVMDRHGSMPHPSHGNLGNLAKAHLASLDKPITLDQPAPEIEALDVFGKRLKLSDFRGKVVLLDFWGHQFAACQSMYPYQRKLVRRLAGKPFVLIGVNADPDRDGVRKRMERENLTWPSWWDGGNIGGPIASRWDIDHWPTLVLIDHKGIIRHLSIGWPDPKEADATIDQMVADVAKDNG